MVTYGDTLEPGIVTSVESALTVTPSGRAPADAGIVGQADLANGTADANTVYQVTTAPKARTWFGEDSALTENVTDALDEGAYPVYAVAVQMSSTTEDLSGITSNEGVLDDGDGDGLADSSLTENAGEITFTINGNALDTTVVYVDPSTKTPGTSEVLVNPVTGEYHIDSGVTIGNAGDEAAYDTAGYDAGIDALEADAGEAVDFVSPLSSNQNVTDYVQTRVGAMANDYDFASGFVGAGSYVDPANFENPYDDSRMLSVYPARQADGQSVLGAYVGLRAAIGINTTPINKNLGSLGDLSESLEKEERGQLIQARVVPLDQQSAGARIADDVNTVSDDNTEEAAIRYGFNRLVVDYVLTIVRESEQPYIGRFNTRPIRESFEGLLNNRLNSLKRSNAVVDFNISVREVDAVTAELELNVETAKPLRFIENTVIAGDAS